MSEIVRNARRATMVVPTYNEAQNIARLTHEILQVVPDLTICIVDDNSPDGTGAIADGLAAADSRIFVVHRPGKMGLGTAYCAGWRASMERGAELLMSMDADFSHHPKAIPGILEAASNADLVIGSRYVAGGGTVNFTIDRRIISRGAQHFAHWLLRLPAQDCTSGYRCYRKEVLLEIGLENIKSTGYSFLIEILYRAKHLHKRVAEYPITYLAREHGLSKISGKEITGAFRTVLRLLWEDIAGR